jgi:hypothetical protein
MKKYILFFFLILTVSTISAQTDVVAPKLNQQDLKEVRDEYIELQKQKRITKLSVDVKTILIDIIPSIVMKNRNIRFQWDRNPAKNIYIYHHLVHYDSINNSSNTYLKSTIFDKSFSLMSTKKDNNIVLDSDYTNLACIDTFNYNFTFVDDPLKADFILSSFKDTSGHKKQLYIWLYPNLSECSFYHVEAVMPWDIDCYKTKILEEMKFTFNLKLDELERMNYIRNKR